MANKPCVYFFPVYAAGHLISMIEFAKRLSAFDNTFSIHFLLMIPNNPDHNSPLCSSYLQSLQAQNTPFQFHPLPFVEPPTSFDGIEDLLSLKARSYIPHVKAELLASPSPVLGLFVDFFANNVIDVANELNIPSYVFYTSPATSLALFSHLSNQEWENDPKDFSEGEEICVPGLIPIPSTCWPDVFWNRKSRSYKSLMNFARLCSKAKAVVVNSNIYLEKAAVEALTEGTQLVPGRKFQDVCPVGPVLSLPESRPKETKDHECLKWLDRQPTKTVVFLCFGNRGAFDVSQNREIARALEQSGHRFLWVVRTPSTNVLRELTNANLDEVLPRGFTEKTKERGLVWPSLVPQIEILSHKAIGGFVTHCGWNSTMESLWFGVPMVPWPHGAEQHLNAFHLVKELQVAVAMEIDRNNEGFVSAAELERAIKCLMDEGSEERRRVREKAEELKLACRKALEVGGVSYANVQKLAAELGKQKGHSQSTSLDAA